MIAASPSILGYPNSYERANRSNEATGRVYVPTPSYGFIVAITMKGTGRVYEIPASVTCPSAIASSIADCTLAGARLSSSAIKISVKMGHFLDSKLVVLGLYTSAPTASDGRRSEVNCILADLSPMSEANTFAERVFATPGGPTSSICPQDRRAIRARSKNKSAPIM